MTKKMSKATTKNRNPRKNQKCSEEETTLEDLKRNTERALTLNPNAPTEHSKAAHTAHANM